MVKSQNKKRKKSDSNWTTFESTKTNLLVEQEKNAEELKDAKIARDDEKWNIMFQKLLEYKQNNGGSLHIPVDIVAANKGDETNGSLCGLDEKELHQLSKWCNEQNRYHTNWVRSCNNSEFFSQEKRDKLKDAGFEFSELTWDEQYDKLKAYKTRHNTLTVKRDHDENLFKWMVKQRRILSHYFEGKTVSLSEECLKKLVDLGWQKAFDKKGGIRIRDLADELKTWNEKYEQVSSSCLVVSQSSINYLRSSHAIILWSKQFSVD